VALLDDVNGAIPAAMKARDPVRLSALRMLKSALVNRSIERARPLDEAESLQVVTGLVKQRRDSIEQFEKAGRRDLVDKESAEVRLLEEYLPAAAEPADIARAIDAAIAETGATGMKDMGKVMKAALARLAGRGVDGRVVNDLVRQRLAQ
jgi:uncharacterized protein YqeY